MKQQLEQAIAGIVAGLFGELAQTSTVELTWTDDKFGDFATNVSMHLARQLGKLPREIAEQIAERIMAELSDYVADVSVAGPGFINLTLQDSQLVGNLNIPAAQTLAGKTVLVEYSDPNPFKPLHAGHLYTTLVGDAIARLQEASGASVTRLNYGGDVGLHVGKSMWAILRELGGTNPEKLNDIPVAERATWLGEQYVAGTTAYEDDPIAKDEIVALNAQVYQIHTQNDHDSPFAQIYWTCRNWSYEYFTKLYEQLRVTPFDRIIPESEIVPLGLQTVREQQKNGVYEESDGAVVFKGEAFGLHTRVFINSKGLPTYETKDVGLLMTKWQDYHFDRSIVITANEQQQYMAVMLKSVEQFAPEEAERSLHVTHGMVKLAGGMKMSSRKGNIAGAVDILQAAATANTAATGQDNDDTVVGAVKYAFLKVRIGGDIAYDPVESVSLEGNSGPYLQYAYARACSILAKAGNGAHSTSYELLHDLEPGERLLVRKLSEFNEVVTKAAAELMPHHICGYLYELAQTFNRFYENNRVLGNEREAVRLSLVASYAQTLHSGLTLLGIPTPKTM